MMKKICLLMLTTIVSPFVASASEENEESYQPFVVEGKTWFCTEKNVIGNLFKVDYMIGGDTIVNGFPCKKLLSRRERRSNNFDWVYECGLMEEGKKVFKVFSNGRQMLYDFGMEVGDYIVSGGYRIFVERKDTLVTPKGRKYKRSLVKVTLLKYNDWRDEYYYTRWVERIGNSYYPFRLYYELFFDSSFSQDVNECIENDGVIFNQEDYSSEVVTGISSVNVKASKDSPIYFDLQGRRLNGKPEKGVYIKNGKKKVVR